MEQRDIKKDKIGSNKTKVKLVDCDIKINMFSILMFCCLSIVILILILLSFFQSYQKTQKYKIIGDALNSGEFGTASLLANNEILLDTSATIR